MEKEELLFQYKTLSDKAGLLQTNAQNSAGEMNLYRQDLVHRQQVSMYLNQEYLVTNSIKLVCWVFLAA